MVEKKRETIVNVVRFVAITRATSGLRLFMDRLAMLISSRRSFQVSFCLSIAIKVS